MIKKLINKLFQIEIWSICLCRCNINNFIKTNGNKLKDHKTINNSLWSYFADPFIVSVTKNYAELLVEEYHFLKGGQISFLRVNLKDLTYKKKVILKSKHFSYPFYLKSFKKLIIFPEMSAENKNLFYYFNKTKIKEGINYFNKFNLIDPTIYKKNNLYFLFTSKHGSSENKKLLVFYSKNLHGPWKLIKKIGFKRNKSNSRSAGKIFKLNRIYYRPSQDCSKTYGHKLNISKIIKMSKNDYNEKLLFKINPKIIDKYSDGIHHIDFLNNLVLFDKKRYTYSIFKLFYKFSRMINYV